MGSAIQAAWAKREKDRSFRRHHDTSRNALGRLFGWRYTRPDTHRRTIKPSDKRKGDLTANPAAKRSTPKKPTCSAPQRWPKRPTRRDQKRGIAQKVSNRILRLRRPIRQRLDPFTGPAALRITQAGQHPHESSVSPSLDAASRRLSPFGDPLVKPASNNPAAGKMYDLVLGGANGG